MIKVTDQVGQRVATPFQILTIEGELVFEGKSKDERFDTNDHCLVRLKQGKEYAIKFSGSPSKPIQWVAVRQDELTPLLFHPIRSHLLITVPYRLIGRLMGNRAFRMVASQASKHFGNILNWRRKTAASCNPSHLPANPSPNPSRVRQQKCYGRITYEESVTKESRKWKPGRSKWGIW